ncbi:substrate-binding domain-containing protein [Deinococcus hopiensis]|uniref:substrate-binding domain-containing protein n=1 Tax=Deinococcus hopiensis TaxID=309885 RepID=UPI0014820461|nr:substrate-binding domain-containing protein [Deinococcus hopiensis]
MQVSDFDLPFAAKRSERSVGPRKTVAVLTDHMFHHYSTTLLAGAQSVLNAHGYGVTVYVGGHLTPGAHGYEQSSALYNLIRPEAHSGALLFSLTLSLSENTQQLEDFAQFLSPLPLVSVGRRVRGIPGVEVDNHTGMREMMKHLLDTCGYTQLAFVRGILGNFDSDEREGTFRKALKTHGLKVGEHQILSGNYSREAAHRATEEFLTSGCMPGVQVLVCANDDMAEGVMRAVRESGRRIPEDIAVVGFDDIGTARTALPPLTTVRQPIFKEGQASAQMLLSLLGERSDPLTGLSSELVVRESCGVHLRSPPPQVLPNVAVHPPRPVRLPRERQLRQAFSAAIMTDQPPDFLSLWRTAMAEVTHSDAEVSLWRDFLQTLSAPFQAQTAEEARKLAQLQLDATWLLLDAAQTFRATQLHEEGVRSARVAAMFAARSQDALSHAVRDYFDHLRLARYILVVYPEPTDQPSPVGQVVLSGPGPLPIDSGPFETRQLLPAPMQGELDRPVLLVAPLNTAEVHFGYLLYERPDENTDWNEETAKVYFDDETQLRTVTHALLYQRERQVRERHAAELERHAAELERHTHELEAEVQRRTEHIAHREARFRALVQSASDLITVMSEDFSIQYISPAAQAVFGHAPEAMQGRSLLEFAPSDQWGDSKRLIARLLREGQGSTLRREFRFLHASGEERWMEGRITNLLSDPDVGGLVLNSRDITDAVRTRQELEASHQEVLASHQQVLASERLASLGRLTAGLAHEINTPLAATMNYLHSLRLLVMEYKTSLRTPEVTADDHEEISAEMLQVLEDAEKTTGRIGEFIRQMRTHTRNVAGGVSIFDPFKLASETLAMVAHQARLADVELHLEFYPLALSLRGEPGRFTQVLTNLVVNAIHACEGLPRGRRVDVRFRCSGDRLNMQVEDNGTGMTPEVLERIFDPLFTTKDAGKGTGLGLSIIHDIVHGHFGGEITVESTVGAGTLVDVRFKTPDAIA